MNFDSLCVKAGQLPIDSKQLAKACVGIDLNNSKNIPILGDYKEYVKQGTKGGASNDIVKAFQEKMASIQSAKYAIAFPSGSQATTSFLMMHTSQDHILVTDDVYGGTQRYFRKIANEIQKIDFTFADFTNFEEYKNGFKENTKVWTQSISKLTQFQLIWMESPTNPTLKVSDFDAIIQHAHNNKAVVVVDNTFASSYNQQPIKLGADCVMHSCTKYVGGHSDVMMGVICTNNKGFYEKLYEIRNMMGAVANPFECFMCYRGLKTLSVRMQQHGQNALELAKYLQKHPYAEKVNYPGLEDHPQYKLAQKYMKSGGGMLTFSLKGTLEQAKKFFKCTKIGTLAESLGAVETLLEIPALMTHASVPPENRKELGISDTLIRVSVGIQDIEDIKADFDQAMRSACQ